MSFRGVDYFCVDSQFSEQELMVRQTARRFAEERILPLIRDCYRDARFPAELIPEMAELGFLGANLEGYGCAEMSNVEYGLIMQELERVDSGVRSFVSPAFSMQRWHLNGAATTETPIFAVRLPSRRSSQLSAADSGGRNGSAECVKASTRNDVPKSGEPLRTNLEPQRQFDRTSRSFGLYYFKTMIL